MICPDCKGTDWEDTGTYFCCRGCMRRFKYVELIDDKELKKGIED